MSHASSDAAKPSGVVWLCLSCTALAMRLIVVGPLPNLIIMRLPIADGLLSGAYLYIFMQAIGLLWLFAVMLVSVLLVKFIACSISSCLVETSPLPLAQQMVATFTHFCVVRFLIHSGWNLWVIGWESFGDFPTLQRLINGPRAKSPDAASSPPSPPQDQSVGAPKQDRGPFHPAAIAARKIVTIAPGIFLLALHLSLVLSTAYCSQAFWKHNIDDQAGPILEWWVSGNTGFCLGPVPDPTSRLNSAMRFAIFAGYWQWITASFRLFPAWHRALYINGHWVPVLLLVVLIPLSWLHILTVLPLFLGKGRFHIFADHSLEPYIIDNTMIGLWMLWVAILDFTMLQPATLPVSGFEYGFMKGRRWHEFTMYLKFAFLSPVLLKFLWSCFFPGMGLAEAQIDFIMITIAYAGTLMCVWVICFIVVDFPRKKRMILVTLVSLGVAAFLTMVAKMDSILIILIVWGHLLRTQLPWFGSTKRLVVQHDFAQGARRYWIVFLRLGMSVILGFVAVLMFLMMMSYIQEEVRWYPETISIEANDARNSSESDVHSSHVAHTVSHLQTSTVWDNRGRRIGPTTAADGSLRGPRGRYAICGQLFHGLSVLDYSLVALSAYWEPSAPDFNLMLQEFFPPWSDPPLSLKTAI